MNKSTKKMLHIVKEFGVAEIAELNRTGVEPKGRMRTAYNPAVHNVFRAETMFHSIWETSNFFDMFLPQGTQYIEITVLGRDEEELDHNTAWFDKLGREGAKLKGVTYHTIFGDWDDDGVSIMVPVEAVKNLQDMGLRLQINNPSDKPKVRKYFRRIRAHHEWAIEGRVLEAKAVKNGRSVTIKCEGDIKFDMLHIDLSTLATKYDVALADGIHLIDVGLCRLIGNVYGIKKMSSARIGDAFKGTALSALGLGKGFFHIVDSPKYGIILYGPKKQVAFDHFFLGSLGDVKGGDAYSDLQSLINFDYWKDDLAYNQASLFIQKVVESIHDEKKMRHLFLTHMAPLAEVLSNESAGGRETWVLLEALRKGVSLRKNPGLFRRVILHLFTHVLDATKGRIPFMSVGARFNLMPDLNCFDADGGVDYRLSSIPVDAVVCMDLNQGPLAMYRQPSGHKKELVSTTNIHDRRFRKFRGMNRIILGPSAYYQLATMGGGDNDDAVNATDNVDWIKVMATGDYPVTVMPAADESKRRSLDDDNKYRRGPAYPREWSMVDFFEAVAASKERGLSIGPVVNACMLDVLLSGEHKENMLTNIADRIVDAKDDMDKQELREAYDWLRNRPDHVLREVASNLEGFIDYVKMGKGDPMVLEPLVKKIIDVRDNSKVLPSSFMIKNSKGRVRVTAKRLIEKDFITAPSLVCDTLSRISFEVAQLQEALIEEEWLNVDSIPESLSLAFPSDRGFRDEAIQLRNDWREAFQNRNGVELAVAYESALKDVVRPSFNQWDNDIKLPLAVEHARLTYRGRKTEATRNEDGSRRHYPDGLLWTNTIGPYYIKAMEEAGLTGLYVPVQFDRFSRNYSRGTYGITVWFDGNVTITEDGTHLGTLMTEEYVQIGDYTMEDGMITVVEPSEELYMDRNVVNEEFNNPFILDMDDIFANA